MKTISPLSRAPQCLVVACAVLIASGAGCEKKTTTEPLPPNTLDGDGGTLTFAGGEVTLSVPAGAISGPVTFTVTELGPPEEGLGSKRFRIGPTGTTFGVPATIRIAVDAAAIAGDAEMRHMTGAVLADGLWQGLPTTADETTGTVAFRTMALDEPELVPTGQPRGGGGTGAVRYVTGPIGSGGSGGGGTPVPSCERELVLASGQDFAALEPRYVDESGDNVNDGTLGAPWRTITHGVATVGFGQKLVVRAGEYRNAPGNPPDAISEQFPLTLPIHTVIEGDGGPQLIGGTDPAGGTYPILRVGVPDDASYIVGVIFVSDPAITTAGVLDRNPAIEIIGGSPRIENVTSETSGGILVTGGSPAIVGGSLTDYASRVRVMNGDVSIVGTAFKDLVAYSGGDSAAVYSENGTVCVESISIRSCVVGVQAALHGHLTVVSSALKDCDIGVLLGEIPWNTATDVTYELRANSFEGCDRAGVVTVTPTGCGDCLEDNDYDRDPPRVYHGPAPFIEPVDIAHLLDPLGNPQWWELGNAPTARYGARVARDRETGDFVLFGGRRGSTNFADTWVFDPDTYVWTDVTDPFSLVAARVDHMIASTAVRTNQSIFLAGGHSNEAPEHVFGLDTLWTFDRPARTWDPVVPTGPVPVPRYGATLTEVPGTSTLLLVGGVDISGDVLDDQWTYDVDTNTWAQFSSFTPTLNVAFHDAIPFQDGVLVYGGVANALGSPGQGLFHWRNLDWEAIQQTGAVPGPLQHLGLVNVVPAASGQQRATIVGGTSGQAIADVQRVFVAGSSGTAWTSGDWHVLDVVEGSPHPPARTRHAAFSWTAPNGWEDRIVIFGGIDETGNSQAPLQDCWFYSRGDRP